MKKKILYNILSSLMLEIVTVVCAFILPRMIMSGFGSEYNGIVSSVTQFLSVITLLRGGVGGVARAALYRPLAEKDVVKISAILNATERFMRRIAYIFVIFLVAFAAGYPLLVSNEFDWLYTFSLVLILGISTISQYYFGITYQFLLTADQKSYVYSILQMFATILNTIFSVVLINAGVEFRLIKLISSIVFAVIPIALYWYVHKNYIILKSVPCDNSHIKQRWDAFVHQVAAFIHTNTDLMLLTFFVDLYQVSVYSVYYMVVNGVKKFVTVFTSGLEATIGKLIVTKNDKQLISMFSVYEWGINVISITAFLSTAVLIVPFMQVYTRGITDANYNQPLLGLLLCLGSFLACIRLPYQNVVEAAGHFKQTRNGAIIEATINISLSILLIIPLGCIGAAIGTAIAMIFRTIQYALYASKNILKRPYKIFAQRMAVTFFNISIIVILYLVFNIEDLLQVGSIIIWIIDALIVFGVVSVITLVLNAMVYKKTFCAFVDGVLKRKVKL